MRDESRRIRVLVVDDFVVIRRLIISLLERDAGAAGPAVEKRVPMRKAALAHYRDGRRRRARAGQNKEGRGGYGDESRSIFGMPRVAIKKGFVNRVLPLEGIADFLIATVGLQSQ